MYKVVGGHDVLFETENDFENAVKYFNEKYEENLYTDLKLIDSNQPIGKGVILIKENPEFAPYRMYSNNGHNFLEFEDNASYIKKILDNMYDEEFGKTHGNIVVKDSINRICDIFVWNDISKRYHTMNRYIVCAVYPNSDKIKQIGFFTNSLELNNAMLTLQRDLIAELYSYKAFFILDRFDDNSYNIKLSDNLIEYDYMKEISNTINLENTLMAKEEDKNMKKSKEINLSDYDLIGRFCDFKFDKESEFTVHDVEVSDIMDYVDGYKMYEYAKIGSIKAPVNSIIVRSIYHNPNADKKTVMEIVRYDYIRNSKTYKEGIDKYYKVARSIK